MNTRPDIKRIIAPLLLILTIVLVSKTYGQYTPSPSQRTESAGGGCRVCANAAHPATRGASLSLQSMPAVAQQAVDVTVDVMFVYSTATLLRSGGEEAMQSDISESLRLANHAFAASGTTVQFRLAHMGPVAYEDAGDIAIDLNRLSSRHASTEAVWQLREDHQADVVCLLVEKDNYWGEAIANRPTVPGDFNKNLGHVVVYRPHLRPRTLAHEFGHLFGCTHDRGAAGAEVLFPYAFGNHMTVEDTTLMTIMSYFPGVEVPLFSGPNVLYHGTPTGIASGQPGQADNARVIRNTASLVAAYYEPEMSVEFETDSLEVSEDASTVAIRLVLRGGLERDVAATIRVDGGTAVAGEDFELEIPRVTLQEGETTKELVLTLLDDEVKESIETIQLSLHVLQRGIEDIQVGPLSSMQIKIHDNDSQAFFTTDQLRVREGGGAVLIPVQVAQHALMKSGADDQVLVTYDIVQGAGTAEASSDFRAYSGELEFTSDNREQTIRVEILEDSKPERTEQLEVRMDNRSLIVSIVDNDDSGSRSGKAQWNSDVNHEIWDIVPLPGGKTLIGGSFTEVDGQPRFGLARLHADGALDESFESGEILAGLEPSPVTFPPTIFKTLPLRDGKLMIMGVFTSIGGHSRGCIARLNEDGSLDSSFEPNPGADAWVTDAIEQEDGKVVLVGLFHHFSGEPSRGIARVNPDGTLDSTFKITPGPSGWAALLYGICAQSDGKLIVTGFFAKYNDKPLSNIARLHPDGAVDSSFRTIGENIGLVLDAEVDPGGAIYIHGYFESFNRSQRSRVCRLLDNGRVDTSFNVTPALNGKVESMVVAPNGDLVLGGAFSDVAGGGSSHLVRVNRDGSVDPSFQLDRGPDDHVYAVAFKDDQSLLVGGRFRKFENLEDAYLTQINIDDLDPVFESVSIVEQDLVMDIRGIPGQTITLEKSDSLNNWEEFMTPTMESSSLRIKASMTDTPEQRYYRLPPTKDQR